MILLGDADRDWRCRASPSSARAMHRATGSSWRATWRTGWRRRAGASSPAWRAGSTARRIRAPSPPGRAGRDDRGRRRRRGQYLSAGECRPCASDPGARPGGLRDAAGLQAARHPFPAPQPDHLRPLRGVVVVEAALRSGSLITARMAGEQGREVMAVPGSPLDPRCRGTNRLIREGAALIEDAEQILEILTGLRHRSIEVEQPLSEIDQPIDIAAEKDVDKTRRDVLGRLGPSPIAVDELLRQCQSSPPIIGQVLLELDLAGRLERHPGNRVSLLAAPERGFRAPLRGCRSPKVTLESRKTQMKVVVVESPAKAKTINKYLGRDYTRAGLLRPCARPAGQGRLGAAGERLRHELGGRRPRPEAAQGDRRRGQGRRQADPGDRPRPRGRGHLLAHHRGAEGQARPRQGAVQAGRLQRDHQARRARRDEEPARDRPGAGRRLSGPPRARLPGRLHPVAGAVAQAAGQPLGRPRAVGGAAPDLRARGRDRGLQAARILDHRGRVHRRRTAATSRRA